MAFGDVYPPGTVLKFEVVITSGCNVPVDIFVRFRVHEGAATPGTTGDVLDENITIEKNVAPGGTVNFWWDTHETVLLSQGDRDLEATVFYNNNGTWIEDEFSSKWWNDTYHVEEGPGAYEFSVGQPTVDIVTIPS